MAKLTQKETMQIMLDDVVKHFSKDPKGLRCKNEFGCFYHPVKEKPNSNGCAIGMYLPNKVCKTLDKGNQLTVKGVFNNEKLKTLLPKWMQEIEVNFLSDLQSLHDNDNNWNDKGLSMAGKKRVKNIKVDYSL